MLNPEKQLKFAATRSCATAPFTWLLPRHREMEPFLGADHVAVEPLYLPVRSVPPLATP
jgi:hypothetical protein